MANYNKPNGSNKNIGVVILITVFAIIGIACLVIGWRNEIVSWLKTFGIVILVITSPLVVYLLYRFIMNKIKDI